MVGLILEVYNGGKLVNLFRWSFIVFQFVAMLVLSIRYYAVGYIRDRKQSSTLLAQYNVIGIMLIFFLFKANGNAVTGWSALFHLDQLPKTVQLDRMIFPFISITLSVAVVGYCEINEVHFATYLLYTLIANVLGSCIYYIGIMKVSK